MGFAARVKRTGAACLLGLAIAEGVRLLRLTRHPAAFEPGLGDHLATTWAGLGVVAGFALVLGAWLALEAAAGALERRAGRLGVALGGLIALAAPALAVAAVVVVPTRPWRSDPTPFLVAGTVFAAASPLLWWALRRFGRRALRAGPAPRVALAAALLGGAVAAWYLGTSRFWETYGRVHLVAFGVVMWAALAAATLLGPRNPVAPRSPTERSRQRATALAVLALLLAGLLGLSRTPSPAARELFYAATPYRWVLAPLAALQIDVDEDGAPASFGFLIGSDCDDLDAAVGPGRVDVPDNDIDENCFGGDLRAEASAPFAPAPLPPLATGPPRNILVVAIDALRYMRDWPDGIDRELMPRLGAFADEAVRFTDFRLCSPGTRMSVPDILAGSTIGPEVGAARPPLLHSLAAAGYHTMFVSNEIVFQLMGTLGNGFAEVHVSPGFIDFHEDRFNSERLRIVLDEGRPEPWYVYTHFLDAHEPYLVPRRCEQDVPHDERYLCALRAVDEQLGALLAFLEERGMLERTVVAVLADHGEGFGEHGLWAHANSLFDELVHVPLVIRVPGVEPAIREVSAHCYDVAATVLAAARAPAQPLLQGVDLLALADDLAPRPQFARMRESRHRPEANRDRVMAVWDGVKLLWDPATRIATYYDLRADPGEQRPLAQAPRDAEPALSALLDAWLSELARREASPYRPREWGVTELR
jgi:choline-sulfatase